MFLIKSVLFQVEQLHQMLLYRYIVFMLFIGCHIGHHFYGGLGYADDVALLSPSVCGLQLLINTCEKIATEHNVTFNSRNTVFTYFGSRNIIACRQVSLNSVKIP